MRTLAKIKYILLKNNVHLHGKGDIYLEFNNKKTGELRKRISMEFRVPVECWEGEAGKYLVERVKKTEKGKKPYPNAKDWNRVLQKFFLRADQIILRKEQLGETVFFNDFKAELLNEKKESVGLLQFHDDFLEKKRRDGVGKSTFDTYKQRYNKLCRYAPVLKVDDIDLNWITGYHAHLKENGYHPNSIYRELWYVRELCKMARLKGHLKSNPFEDYTLKKIKVNQVFLEWPSEVGRLERLYAADILPANQQERLREALFAIFTGLDYADLNVLESTDIKASSRPPGVREDELTITHYIYKGREKNESGYFIPLVPESLALIEQKVKAGAKLFNCISNTKANVQLRIVMEKAGIKKYMTFKKLRHTFGTMMLNRGVRREIVQGMMGHASPEMTDHYAKLLNPTIIKEVNHAWSKR